MRGAIHPEQVDIKRKNLVTETLRSVGAHGGYGVMAYGATDQSGNPNPSLYQGTNMNLLSSLEYMGISAAAHAEWETDSNSSPTNRSSLDYPDSESRTRRGLRFDDSSSHSPLQGESERSGGAVGENAVGENAVVGPLSNEMDNGLAESAACGVDTAVYGDGGSKRDDVGRERSVGAGATAAYQNNRNPNNTLSNAVSIHDFLHAQSQVNSNSYPNPNPRPHVNPQSQSQVKL